MICARSLVFAVASMVLVACSNGGDDSPPPPPPAPPPPPTITQQPATSYVVEGTSTSLTVVATGNGALSYVWRRNGTAIQGATSATYNIPSVAASHDGDYDCVVTNTLNSASASTTSQVGRLIVVTLPVITQQPQSTSVLAGTEVQFQLLVTANGIAHYTLRRDGITVAEGGGNTYLIVNAQPSDAGTYVWSVVSTLGGVTTPAVNSAPFSLGVLSSFSAVVTAEATVLANSTGHLASIQGAAGTTIAWSVTNGTITAGQGTPQITYTAGSIGNARIAATISAGVGAVYASRNQRVLGALPIAEVFSQPVVHPEDRDIRATASGRAGNTYLWSWQNLGATVGVPGGVVSGQPFFYMVGSPVGQYSLQADVHDGGGNSTSVTRTLTVASNVFLKDKRDPAPRSLHTATLMNDGRVLVVGGDAGLPQGSPPQVSMESRILGTAEIYDPISERWADAAAIDPRFGHSATLLNDGRVLVVGGAGPANNYLASGALYDPVARTWSASGSLTTARKGHRATLLANGHVLVTGGEGGSGALRSAEVYDPVANVFGQTGDMLTARIAHSATLMNDGRVLVSAGSATEIFNPVTGTWAAAAANANSVNSLGAVLLPNDKVLQLGTPVTIYDPVANTWTALRDGDTFPPGGALISAVGESALLLPDGSVYASGTDNVLPVRVHVAERRVSSVAGGTYFADTYSTATLLADDNVLLLGGIDRSSGLSTGGVKVYSSSGNLTLGRGSFAHRGSGAAVAALPDGRVLFAGGSTRRDSGSLGEDNDASLFDPANNRWIEMPSMISARAQHAAATVLNNRVIVTGGRVGTLGVLASTEYFDAGTMTWTPAGSLSGPRYRHTTTALPNGNAIAIGGRNATSCNCTTFQPTVDLYNAATNSWSTANPLLTARESHTATALSDGRILVTGGYGGATNTLADTGTVLASSELFDPATGSWSATGAMSTARRDHVAISLGGGRVLVAGGTNGSTTLASAEIYDSATGGWTPAAAMNTPRQAASAALLADGRVLVANGLNGANSALFGVGSGEVYDPVANSWSTPVPTVVPRSGGTAVSLPDGRAMIVGGYPSHAGVPEFYR